MVQIKQTEYELFAAFRTHIGLTLVSKMLSSIMQPFQDLTLTLSPLVSSVQAEKTVRMTKTTTRWICPSAQSHRKVGLIFQARDASVNTFTPEKEYPIRKLVSK